MSSETIKGFVRGLILATIMMPSVLSAAVPNVVVTIKPIHELTKLVMQGVGDPKLLLEGTADPHHFSLRPSHARKLKEADFIIWVGPTLESFLVKPLIGLKTRKLTLMGIEGMKLISRDSDHACVLAEACVDLSKAQKHVNDLKQLFDKQVTALDPHIWLSIENVKLMVKEIAFHLSAIDLENAKIYQENAKALVRKLDTFQGEIASSAAPLAHFHFVAFHDGYGYLEYDYKIKNSAADLITTGQNPGLKSLSELKKIIKSKKISCILVDPQHASKLEQKLAADHDMTLIETDPLGIEILDGEDHYFTLIRTLIDRMKSCMEHGSNGVAKRFEPKAHKHPHTHHHSHVHDEHTPHDHLDESSKSVPESK